ncbi:MAG: hypothetical protein IKP95_09960 [Ruminococcus sp.]|nr:hypothetical protein [Ruminococcus sp.]
MNTLTTRALVTLLSVLILFTIGSQIYYRVNDRHKTEEAVLCSINENIPFKGIVVRNEKVITYSGSGVYEYLYRDGSKISTGNKLADVYSSTSDLLKKKQADRYNSLAEYLERAQNPGASQYVQPESINAKIEAEYKKIIQNAQKGDLTAVSDARDEFFLQSSIYNIITERSENYADEIASLRSKAEKCLAGSGAVAEVEASESGYFVSYCDSYEKKLNLDNIDSLNKSDIESVINGENKQDNGPNAIGKMFDDYNCEIIGIIRNDKRITEGSSATLSLGNKGSIYKVTVDSVKPADEDNSIIILSCNRLDSEIVSQRVFSCELVFDNYQGIKVPREAIRFKGDQKGVYVILGNEYTFKNIDVIYEGSDFVISRSTSDPNYLLLYDRILLEAVSNQNGTDSESSS